MIVDFKLDREDLECLINGSHVPYECMDHHLIKQMGKFNGSYDRWSWGSLTSYSNTQLIDVYKYLKNNK